MLRVKICCIQSVDEAREAVGAGASALGLVSKMPSGPGPIAESRIREIANWTPPGISTFLLTSLTTAEKIVEQYHRCRTSVIQLVDSVAPDDLKMLRSDLPGVKLVQVLHVQHEGVLQEVLAVAEHVDALLLDSGNPQAEVKTLGGTGRVHDWSISAKIVEQSPKPVYLAGGLTPHNVAEAITTVRPFGVDVCRGVRTDGKLDATKVTEFIAVVERAANG